LASLVFFSIASTSASASNYFVDPAGNDLNSCTAPGGAMACKTVQGAINKTGSGDVINVAAGTYAELITVTDRSNLTIFGAGTSTVIVPPAGPLVPNQPLVQILDSRRIGFFNIRVTGTGSDTEGFRIFFSTSVTIGNCTVEGHDGAGGGFFVNGSLGVIINATTIQDNGLGLRVDANSHVALSSPPFAGANSVVQRNGIGVQIRSGEFEFQGSGIIQDNGTGILVEGGGVKACCENQSAPRRVNNNIVGMLVRTGSRVELRGPMEFVGNQNFAIRQFGSGVTISGKVLFQTNGNVVTSAINLSGGHLLLTGGVGSDQIVIKDNAGTGIFLTDNASLRMSNVTVTNNQVHGLRLQALSSAVLAGNIFMNNNSGRDLSCAPNTFARGNNSGVNTQYCPGFDNSPDPHGP
jgi:hypothetical protein